MEVRGDVKTCYNAAMFILLPILLGLVAIGKLDLDLDGKKDEVLIQSFPEPGVALGELKQRPTYITEVYVKILGKIELAGTVRGVYPELTGGQIVRHKDKKPVKFGLALRFVTPTRPLYYFVYFSAGTRLIQIPGELYEFLVR